MFTDNFKSNNTGKDLPFGREVNYCVMKNLEFLIIDKFFEEPANLDFMKSMESYDLIEDILETMDILKEKKGDMSEVLSFIYDTLNSVPYFENTEGPDYFYHDMVDRYQGKEQEMPFTKAAINNDLKNLFALLAVDKMSTVHSSPKEAYGFFDSWAKGSNKDAVTFMNDFVQFLNKTEGISFKEINDAIEKILKDHPSLSSQKVQDFVAEFKENYGLNSEKEPEV